MEESSASEKQKSAGDNFTGKESIGCKNAGDEANNRESNKGEWMECKVTKMRRISRSKARRCAEFVREMRSSSNRSIEKAVKGQDSWGVDEKGNGRNEGVTEGVSS